MQNNKSILVIGDGIIDIAIRGNVTRLSPEAPVAVVEVTSEHATLGGAANVAAHISNANIKCILAYKTSNPDAIEDREFVESCNKYNIDRVPLVPHDSQANGKCLVPKKKRVWGASQQLCRLDWEINIQPNTQTENLWIDKIINACLNYNVGIILFSDYNKGTLSDRIIETVAEWAKQYNIKTLLDPKRPTWTNIHGLFAIKPNGVEIKQTNLSADLCSIAIGDTYLINTIGEHGVKCWQNGEELFWYPSFAKKDDVKDVTGCGDEMASVIGIGLHRNVDLEECIIAANKGAYYCIQKIGTYVLTTEEIQSCFEYARKQYRKT